MLLDLLKTDNYVSFNKKLAHIIGLEAAIYINQLVNITGKALQKDKTIDDDFILLDRNYIYNQTTISIEKQIELDAKLIDAGLILTNFENPDIIKVDIEMLSSIVSSEDKSQLDNLTNKFKVRSKKEEREIKNRKRINYFKTFIDTGNQELDSELGRWVEVIFIDKKSYVSPEMIQAFQRELYDYTNGNVSKALEIVKIAIDRGYRECGWAAKIYFGLQVKSTTVQQVADNTTVSNKEF